MNHLFYKTSLSAALYLCYSSTFAQNIAQTDQQLATIEVYAMLPDEKNYAAQQASSLLKTDSPLFETARSVSVVTQELIQQKQATSVGEALDGIAGVTANPYGRRGFDDFIIRGQVSSDQLFVDGLRLTSSIFSSVELTGTDTVQVLKGPSSVEFGAGAVGGAVNLTTKRPQANTFYRAGLSYGSYQDSSATFDINYAPHENSDKGAFRLVGRAGYKEDPVDEVYFKNYYISPSYNFDLGDKTDVSVVASYQYREFIRQQGLPTYGTIIKNPNATYDESRFTGEPNMPYRYNVYRLGYNLAHQLNPQWTYKQNFAINHIDMDADVVLTNGTASNMFADNTSHSVLLRRTFNTQDRIVTNYAMDNRLNGEFNLANMQHNISVGVDAYKENNDYHRVAYTLANLNLNQPIYGSQPNKITANTKTKTDSQYIGIYAKDQIKFNQPWILGLAARYDWANTKTLLNNQLTHTETENKKNDHAFTGSASLMYVWHDTLSPYMSFATSFLPVSDTDINGNILNPEKGLQYEVGLKFQGFNRHLQGSLSAYELTRKNVVVSSLEDSNYKESTGKQTTRGIELEVAADLFSQWNVAASYSYIPYAKIVDDKEPQRIGLPIDHVPTHSANLMTRYYFDDSKLGWYIGGNMRYEGAHTAQRPHRVVSQSTYAHLPSYLLFDMQTGYKSTNWGAHFNIKNIFDKHYYAGTTPNAALIATGMPRTFNFGLTFNF